MRFELNGESRYLINNDSIEKIVADIKNSNICNIIRQTSHNTVIFDGNIDSKILVIGEAPGAEEEEIGKPFVGKSGKLLDKILHYAGLDRKTNIMISNSVFWRPPNNRKPTKNEILECKPFLDRIINLIKPELIILCGSTSIDTILGKSIKTITELVGTFNNYNFYDKNIKCFIIYHPSYLFHKPIMKKDVWSHIKILKSFIEKLNLCHKN